MEFGSLAVTQKGKEQSEDGVRATTGTEMEEVTKKGSKLDTIKRILRIAKYELMTKMGFWSAISVSTAYKILIIGGQQFGTVYVNEIYKQYLGYTA